MKLYYSVILSLTVHFFSYITADKIASHFKTLSEPEIEVVLVDPEKAKVVLNPVTPKPDSEEPSNTPLLSEKNQRFKKQTRAQNIGRTQNTSSQLQDILKKSLEETKKTAEQIAKNLKVPQKEKQIPSQNQQNPNIFPSSPLPSTVNDPLTNIPIGSFTAMNTNRYLFYSFYQRVDRQIRHRWESKLLAAMNSRPPVKMVDRDRGIWSTELEIILDKKGYFLRADVHRSSGITLFDLAAIDVFKEGAPILNPPKGLAAKDGKIYLQYNFNVYWNPSEHYRR